MTENKPLTIPGENFHQLRLMEWDSRPKWVTDSKGVEIFVRPGDQFLARKEGDHILLIERITIN